MTSEQQTDSDRPPARRLSRRQWLLATVLLLAGSSCVSTQNQVAQLPSRYEIESGDLIIRSDLKIKSDHPLIEELRTIQRDVVQTLALPKPHRPVVIHLFSDEERYSQYMQARHPNLPPRRAFFIGSPTELGVYAHWSPNVNEDLRHEYTHGVLHASLRTVPLWLDEGLAEYYETAPGSPQRMHREHTQRLAVALKNGWRPDLARLEKIEEVAQMGRADYQEAWAWVHYLLHDAPGGQELLVEYCRELRKAEKPPHFYDQVAKSFPDADLRLASYISLSLTDHGRVTWASGEARVGKPEVRPE
ncbi:hypothetical protein [Planctomicrobium piriforme]|uniref:DUF1570 domain-containing protein n=1 Tax=Planctomicrobium piriforme TaxID=1576369 RepID=A0A1I3HQV8_9PLAN|nr:hypothetical protein [Planctomicrobium piriforme]SFI38013.1 hypothetical protein SAMN05421753_108156 [Planctomicrobium piriforme]